MLNVKITIETPQSIETYEVKEETNGKGIEYKYLRNGGNILTYTDKKIAIDNLKHVIQFDLTHKIL